MPSTTKTPEEKMTFQQQMNRLQVIVNELNNPDLELEKAMALFKEGLALSKNCQSELSAFEKEMNTLIEDQPEK